MTIKEIAKLAGVSVSTVSKIMNGKDESISAETRARVLSLAKEYHYTPYASVLSSNSKSLTIGVVFSSPQNVDMVLQGILETAQNAGYTLMICVSNDDEELEYKHISAMIQNRVDGVLWQTTDNALPECEAAMLSSKLPFLIFNSEHPQAVNLDYQMLSYQATLLLLEQHHREIACLLKDGRRTHGVLQGYRQCLFDNGIPFQPDLVFTDISQNLLNRISSRSVSGLVSSHYSSALAFYEKLQALHYSLPYDVSLVSLKSDTFRETSYPNISSYVIPHYSFGSHICEQLIARLESTAAAKSAFTPQVAISSMATVGIPYNAQCKKILVVGSINIDNYLRVDKLPYSGKAVISSIAHQYPGGKGMNQAVGVSLLGHRVSLIGNVGNDFSSDTIFSSINHYHIDPKGIRRQIDSKTGQAYIFVQQDGNSMISIMAGANSELSPQYIYAHQNLFDNAAFCLLQTEIPLETVKTACMMAKQNHVQTILKPAACGPLPKSLLQLVDYLVPNEDELREICPQFKSMEQQVDHLLQQGVETVIVTLGSKGCYVKNAHMEQSFPAADFQSIDSSGACDAFISALASYLLYGYSLEVSIKIATYAAGFSVTREGVIPSLIDKNTLEFHIRQKDSSLLA